MTTVIGIKAQEGIVLFADTQVGYPERGIKVPEPHHKIRVIGDYCVVAHSGLHIKYDKAVNSLCNGSKKSVQKLHELLERRFVPDYRDSFDGTSMLVVLRLEQPILYKVNCYGSVVRVRKRFVALGSGAKYAEKFLQSNLNGNLSLDYTIDVGYKSMRHAFHDIGTGGFVDFAIITTGGIDRDGVAAHKEILGLERAIVAAAQEKYRK